MTRYLRLAFIVGLTLAVSWLFVKVLRSSVFDIARVTNESMLPYLKPGETIVIRKTSPCIRVPMTNIVFFCEPCKTGRAYLFQHPDNPGHRLVKFAALPPAADASAALRRDIIWFTQGSLLQAHSLNAADSCYFEGSNREHSVDSRHFGKVPVANIEGQVIYPSIRMQSPQ